MRSEESLELKTIGLLEEMVPCLSNTLNSLGGKKGADLWGLYLFYSAAEIVRLGDGYVLLRKNKRVDSSKHLIRPAIEIMH